MIMSFILPESFTSPAQNFIRCSRREALNGFRNLGNGYYRIDAEGDQLIQPKLPVSESKSVYNALRDFGLFQPHGSGHRSIQLPIKRHEGTSSRNTCSTGIPACVRILPDIWEWPMQAPRKENGCALRMPVREISFVVRHNVVVSTRAGCSHKTPTQARMPVLQRQECVCEVRVSGQSQYRRSRPV
jgi:hypothetical protein